MDAVNGHPVGFRGSLPDRGTVITRWRGGTYLFGGSQNEHVSPPTYLSEGLASAPPTPAFYRQDGSPARGPRTRDMDVAAGDAQAAAPEVAPEATPVEVPVDAPATSPEPGKHHHDVTVSRSFVAPCRAEPRPSYQFGAARCRRKVRPTYLSGRRNG